MIKIIKIKTEYIKLGQLLKLLNIISNGSDSKMFLDNNSILVNGKVENRRGRKIYPDYQIEINGIVYQINKDDIY